MISGYEKFRLVDQNKSHEFYAEVNWNEKDPKSNQCQLVKFTFPNGDEAYVKREQLNQILFMIGKEEDQQKMIPQKIIQQRYLRTTLGITAQKDIRKGEKINIPVEIPLPSIEQEIIGEIRKDVGRKDLIA